MGTVGKVFGFVKNLLTGEWKLTIAAISGIIVGICLGVIATCGEVLREVITGERTPADAATQIGLLSLTLLGGVTLLVIAKFRTAIARQNALKRKCDNEATEKKILPFTEERERRRA